MNFLSANTCGTPKVCQCGFQEQGGPLKDRPVRGSAEWGRPESHRVTSDLELGRGDGQRHLVAKKGRRVKANGTLVLPDCRWEGDTRGDAGVSHCAQDCCVLSHITGSCWKALLLLLSSFSSQNFTVKVFKPRKPER